MTTLQKTLVTAAIAILAGAGIYEAQQAAQLRDQNQTLQQERTPLTEQNQQLQKERDAATNRLAGLLADISRLKSNPDHNELLKLRGEVTRLRPLQQDVATLKKIANNAASEMPEWKPEQLMNVGRANPQDALQTYLWSTVNTNLSELGKSLVADENEAASTSGMVRFIDDPMNHPNKDIGSFKLLSQKIISPSEVQLEVQAKVGEETGVSKTLTLRNIDGDWKLVMFFVRDAEGKVSIDLGTKSSAH